MPEISEIVGSDDEYHDAECDKSTENSTITNTPQVASTVAPTAGAPITNEVIVENSTIPNTPTANVAPNTPTANVAPTTKAPSANEVKVEDLFDKNLPLYDDAIPKEAACGSSTEKEEEIKTAEYIPEDIDEAELAEKEKSMTPEELEANQEKANKMKLEANELFKNNRAEEAIDIYTDALKLCPLKATKERSILYGNRAAAKIQINSKKSALEDCSKALELWPDYVRALIRRAKLYEYEDKLDEALADYKHVYDLDPGQSDAREAMVRLPPIIQERNERLKEEMFDKLKDLGNMILKPFGLSTSNFQMEKDPNSGSYSVNFNQHSN